MLNFLGPRQATDDHSPIHQNRRGLRQWNAQPLGILADIQIEGQANTRSSTGKALFHSQQGFARANQCQLYKRCPLWRTIAG